MGTVANVPELVVAIEAGAVDLGDGNAATPTMINVGDIAVADHPIVSGRAHMWAPLPIRFGVEDSAPSASRQVPVKPRAEDGASAAEGKSGEQAGTTSRGKTSPTGSKG